MTDPYAAVKAHFDKVAGVTVNAGRGAQGGALAGIGTRAATFRGCPCKMQPRPRGQAGPARLGVDLAARLSTLPFGRMSGHHTSHARKKDASTGSGRRRL
jgi:hypothetical protein